jgi:hypothetical protein
MQARAVKTPYPFASYLEPLTLYLCLRRGNTKMPLDPGLLIAAISALSSMISAGVAALGHRRTVRQARLKQLEKRAEKPLKRGGKQLGRVIDDATLKTLTDKIQSSVSELNAVLADKNAGDTKQKDALAKASKEICQALSQIRSLNKGELPTQTLKNYWESHQCV